MTPGYRLTIAEEVKEGCFGDAAALVRIVLADEHDLDGFHALEDRQANMGLREWMPQALACLAADLASELAEARNKVAGERLTGEDVLAERVAGVEHLVRLAWEKRAAG